MCLFRQRLTLLLLTDEAAQLGTVPEMPGTLVVWELESDAFVEIEAYGRESFHLGEIGEPIEPS